MRLSPQSEQAGCQILVDPSGRAIRNNYIVLNLAEPSISNLFLFSAIVLLCASQKRIALGASIAALLSGLYFHQLDAVGFLLLVTAGVSAEFYSRSHNRFIKTFALVLFTAIALLGGLSGAHLLPGVWNSLALDGIRLSPDSIPYKIYLNLDKPFMGFCLLYSVIPSSELRFDRSVLRWTLGIVGVLVALMMPLALAIHYVRVDLKVPEILPLWLINNLVFVCVAEESFFRGLVQGELRRKLGSSKLVEWSALFLGAVLFGLSHFKGGPAYIVLAGISGLFYGFAYLKTKSFFSPVLVHFLFNLIHLLFFSYPALDLSLKMVQ